jgi:hypothetical protein
LFGAFASKNLLPPRTPFAPTSKRLTMKVEERCMVDKSMNEWMEEGMIEGSNEWNEQINA